MKDTTAATHPERFTPRWRVFETTDLEVARTFMNAALGTRGRMSGNEQYQPVRYSRYDLGAFCVDDVALSMDTQLDSGPLERLAVLQTRSGCAVHGPSGVSGRVSTEEDERFGPDDVTIVAQPDQSFSVLTSNLDFSSVLMDVPLLIRTAGIGEDAPSGPIRFSRLKPPTRDAADNWRRTVRTVRDLLENDFDAMSEPLVRGGAARLLAACALETFPNTAIGEPTSKDSRDATPGTLRKALAFIEDNAHTDIGLADVAAAASVSPHALRFAFARHHDTSLRGQLRRVRLSRAHFDLLTADPTGGATVAGVAARWGFAKAGRFSALYRDVYGVVPDEILAL